MHIKLLPNQTPILAKSELQANKLIFFPDFLNNFNVESYTQVSSSLFNQQLQYFSIQHILYWHFISNIKPSISSHIVILY